LQTKTLLDDGQKSLFDACTRMNKYRLLSLSLPFQQKFFPFSISLYGLLLKDKRQECGDRRITRLREVRIQSTSSVVTTQQWSCMYTAPLFKGYFIYFVPHNFIHGEWKIEYSTTLLLLPVQPISYAKYTLGTRRVVSV